MAKADRRMVDRMRMTTDVAVIGAGPSGSVAAAYLAARGYSVEVVERQHFPRFSIGESLLPQAMVFLEEAGLLDCVVAAKFQYKNGAVFRRGDEEQSLDFRDKSAPGWGTTFQVRRDLFDHVLANAAAEKGARIAFGEEVIRFAPGDDRVWMLVRNESGSEREIAARFALDASGFGRVLARLLSLDRPANFPVRKAVFSHVRDHVSDVTFDRDKILVSVHPQNSDVWYWLIPLADGLSSIGVVGTEADLSAAGADNQAQLVNLLKSAERMSQVLENAEQIRPAGTITGYACNVDRLSGPGFALLGNAAEFLDPVFSSGVTIALKSAILAGRILDRKFRGEIVDWENEFERPLKVGIETFRAYVEGWYDASLQDVIFLQPKRRTDVTRKIISVLAGYAWDLENPFVREPRRHLAAVHQLVAARA
ncbi:MAG TPA: NAD(P)/FAD-dependent oxidoreductase [Rhizomicrobium sp.]|nr:NAD(P)/FAD-dependent oxidoreductase [Rhizomicrobium sp.]